MPSDLSNLNLSNLWCKPSNLGTKKLNNIDIRPAPPVNFKIQASLGASPVTPTLHAQSNKKGCAMNNYSSWSM